MKRRRTRLARIARWALAVSAAVVVFALGVPAADEAEPVGAETCEVCHDEVVAGFATNPHWRAGAEFSCEGCHGNGSAHVDEGGDATLIRRFGAGEPATQINTACLSCHERGASLSGYPASEHAQAGVSCLQCHAVHDAKPGRLLRADTPQLCYECHELVQASFLLNERHPVNQGTVECQDCHDPHARQSRALLGGFKQETCLACHTEYRGPWVFEHESVAVEGCGSCHQPHGSVNRHLLLYQRAGDTCLQCHAEQPFFHDLTDAGGSRTNGVNDCTACHVSIHGSNNDALFLN